MSAPPPACDTADRACQTRRDTDESLLDDLDVGPRVEGVLEFQEIDHPITESPRAGAAPTTAPLGQLRPRRLTVTRLRALEQRPIPIRFQPRLRLQLLVELELERLHPPLRREARRPRGCIAHAAHDARR